MKVYADSNFFTRLFLRLPDSSTAVELLRNSAPNIERALPVTWLHRMEVANAFQLHIFVSRAPGQARVTIEQAAAAHAAFRDELEEGSRFRQSPLPSEELESIFDELSLRHTAKHGFRTYDLLHVAASLLLDCDTFWTFDPKASRLAALEGFKLR